MSGEPFSGGGAICGASGNWTATLCTRWSLLALSTFPLTRYIFPLVFHHGYVLRHLRCVALLGQNNEGTSKVHQA